MRLGVSQQELDCFVPMLSEWLFDPIVEAVDGLDMPILVSEHNDPWKIEELWWSRDKRIACFNRASAIHLLLENFRASLPSHLTPRVSVIPNGIRIDPEILSSPVDDRPKRFIAVGRLAPQKRFDRLIRAFARISSALPDWRLDIFGEGGEAGKLQKIIAESFLSDRVTLRGQSTLINKELVNSSVFVLPSEFEGFGIVVIEAKMAGLPTIAYANCAGPNELVRHNVDGLLSQPDEEGENLAAAMVALATNEDRRVGMATRARENIVDFDIERVVGRWEEILAKIVREHDAGATDKLVD
jgi:glycosyltransferase involved in cell wall biosynthesis